MTNRHCLAIRVDGETRTRFVVMMGNSGIEFGMVCFNRFRDFVNMFRPYTERKLRIPQDGHLGLRFRPLTTLPRDDGRVFVEAKWESRDSLFPVLLEYRPDSERMATAADLAWFEAACRAVVKFHDERLADDGEGGFIDVETTMAVPVGAGPSERGVNVYVRYPGGEVPKSQTVLVDMVKQLEEAGKNGNFQPGCMAHQHVYKAMAEQEEAQKKAQKAAEERSCACCGKGGCEMRCSACRAVRYCCQTCQKEDWAVHKKECKRLKEEVEREERGEARPAASGSESSSHGHSHSHSHSHAHSHDHSGPCNH